jgi:tetratricopeptide (TPR) repeat protein
MNRSGAVADRADRLRAVARGPWPAVILGVACYLNTVANDFTYDDCEIVRDNPRIRSLTDLRGIWLSDWWYTAPTDESIGSPLRDRLYRPLTMFSFALNYAVSGLSPAPFHAVNVALHGLVCALVWRFAQAMWGDSTLASIAAALFAVHPVHAEAVAGVVGRAEILAAMFLLLGLLALLPAAGRAGPARLAMASAAMLAAVLSKETAVCYPALVLIVVHATRSARRDPDVGGTARRVGAAARPWLLVAMIALPLVIYFPLRFVALEQRLMRDVSLEPVFNPLFRANPAGRLLGPLTILGHYTRLLLLPDRLACDYGMGVISRYGEWNVETGLGLAAAGAMALALSGYRGRLRAGGPAPGPVAVCTALFLASYALISNTVLLIGVSLAERLMYWPSVPALLGVSALLVHLWRKHAVPGGAFHRLRRLLAAAGAALLAGLALRTVVRGADWRDNETLFAADVRSQPHSVQLNNAQARVLLSKSAAAAPSGARSAWLDEAELRLKTAQAVYPGYADTLLNLGRLHLLRGDVRGALSYLEITRALNPRNRDVHELLAALHEHSGQASRPVEALQERVAAQPDDVAARVALGEALLAEGRHHAARRHLEHALARDPDHLPAAKLLYQVLALEHEDQPAIQLALRVLAHDPDDWTTHANLVSLLAPLDPPAALRHARRAYELAPEDLRNQSNLAEALVTAERVDEALPLLRRIERSLPADDPRRAAYRDRIRELERGIR